jgi:hypothetical protein
MPSDLDNTIRAFGMSGFQISDDLSQIGTSLAIDLGHFQVNTSSSAEKSMKLFEQKVQVEAAEMATYYTLFYCLEKSIRELITNNLREKVGANWWDTERVPQQVQDEVTKRRKAEIDTGVTSRSDEPIDFTTFGELEVIITKNWDVFSLIFDSQRAVQRVMNSLNVLRGPIAHCCPYSEDEKERLRLTVNDWIRML